MAKDTAYTSKLQGFADRVKTEPVQLPVQKVMPVQTTAGTKDEQQLNVWIPKNLMKQLKVKGIETDKSLKEMVIEALGQFPLINNLKMIAESVKEDISIPSLKGIDWDFVNSIKGKSLHSIHPYPAKFIPEIPGNIIDALQPSREGIILDPFCGSGVSLVEAQRRGYNSVGIDLNPIACLISKVKTHFIDLSELQITANEVISIAKCKENYSIPNIPNLNHWFNKESQIGLTKLIESINSLSDSIIKDAMLLACSSIIVRVSNQDSDTRYAAVEKNIIENNVYDYFGKAVNQLISVKAKEEYSSLADVKIINGNILTTDAGQIKEPISLLVTSPPYPNAYEYWLYHKYRMWWLGFDPIKVKDHEIGARAHFFKKKHHTGEDFSAQMEKLFENVTPLMMPNAYVVFVVGRSIIHGKEYANHDVIAQAGEKFNFLHIETLTREMNKSRKSFNLAHARIKQEFIVVLQNQSA